MAYRHGTRRRETFYKVQRWNGRVAAWVDARKKTFDTLDEARAFLGHDEKGARMRILQYVNGKFVEVS